jgi:release factor glutamine methyltransferase
MRKIKDLRDNMIEELCAIYPENESRLIVNWLVCSVTGWDNAKIALEPDIIPLTPVVSRLKKGMEELMAHKPVQYVTGQAFFYDLELDVNPSVLIPRPETEELVKWICDDNKTSAELRILDIGTGSGCIILALGRQLNKPELTAIDNSPAALATARRNALKSGLNVHFRQLDILTTKDFIDKQPFNVIVSNPPYVRNSERGFMKPNVLDYEPGQALFVPDEEPLIFYRAIAGFAKKNLAPGGKLYLEINENLGKETLTLFIENGFNDIILRKDLQGKDRMIRCGFDAITLI